MAVCKRLFYEIIIRILHTSDAVMNKSLPGAMKSLVLILLMPLDAENGLMAQINQDNSIFLCEIDDSGDKQYTRRQ